MDSPLPGNRGWFSDQREIQQAEDDNIHCIRQLCCVLWGKLLQLCLLFVTPWTIGHQAPLSMGFSRQEYWSGLPCPSPGDLPDPGIEPTSLVSPALAGGFFITSATWEAQGCDNKVPQTKWLTHFRRPEVCNQGGRGLFQPLSLECRWPSSARLSLHCLPTMLGYFALSPL